VRHNVGHIDAARDAATPNGASQRRAPRVGWRLGALLVCGAVAVLLCLVSLGVGARAIPVAEVWTALLHRDGSRDAIIVWQLRMPRTMLTVTVGVALAVAGVIMQAVTRNPLAEPGLLGLNSGASFAVVLAISVLGVTDVAGFIWFAFAGALLAALLVYALGTADPVRLVLAGAALSASLGACTGIVTMFDSATFDSYRFWVVGALATDDPGRTTAILPFVVVGVLLALALGPALNALALGDDLGTALGVRVPWVRAGAVTAIVLLCGAATAAAGPIAFVGLVVPHVLRLLLGPDLRWLLGFCLPCGPILLLASDITGRVLTRPAEIEAGIITAFVGAPVLLWLVTRAR